MFKKTFLSLSFALALGAVAAPALASSKFFLVVPLSAQAQAQEPAAEAIAVSLAGAALPKATVNMAYSESLRPYLSVTGDAAFDPAAASWALAEGTLPVGLSLDETTGAVAGTPTTKTTSPASFTVLATYKGQDGQAVYTIEVGGEVLNVTQLALGAYHSCALTRSQGVVCWGQNTNQQVGIPTSSIQASPVAVPGLPSDIKQIVTGYYFSCALTESASIYCWGRNDFGQLGRGTTSAAEGVGELVALRGNVKQLAASGSHACAIDLNDTLKCWGYNTNGQVGIGTTNRSVPTPAAVSGLLGLVRSATLGEYYTCATLQSGDHYCWGSNLYGQLGVGDKIDAHQPKKTIGLSNVVSASAGRYHSCATTADLGIYCWGRNPSGELGIAASDLSESLVPHRVPSLEGRIKRLAGGATHTCALTHSDEVLCWGWNGYGQLGDGTMTSRWMPQGVPGLSSGIVEVHATWNHTCTVASNGEAKCWGMNNMGQLGNNSTANSLVPVNVEGLQ